MYTGWVDYPPDEAWCSIEDRLEDVERGLLDDHTFFLYPLHALFNHKWPPRTNIDLAHTITPARSHAHKNSFCMVVNVLLENGGASHI